LIFSLQLEVWQQQRNVYLAAMVSLNVSGLFIYNLYGHFGPFHWMALGSLLTLMAGMVPVFTRRPPRPRSPASDPARDLTTPRR